MGVISKVGWADCPPYLFFAPVVNLVASSQQLSVISFPNVNEARRTVHCSLTRG